jgi:LysR family nitrogen assimilation transcriptional regulator
MRGTLDLRRLRYFLAIAENGSLSAAARALNLAQPALSYHVAELERLLGLSLFDRSRDGVALTEAGRLLQRHAREIVEKANTAEAAMQGLARRREPAARVRIALISSLAADLMPILVETVARERPEVTLSISEAGTREIEQKLERAEADMAVYLASTHGPVEQPVATEQLFFIAPGSDNRNEGTITLLEMAQQRLVLPARGNPLRAFVETVARQNGLTMDVVLEVDGSRSRRNAVLSGIGCTVLGAHSVASEGLDAGLSVREIVSPRLFRPIYLGVRRNFDPELTASMSALLRSALMSLGLSAPQGG